jgi:outer membrane murein-binding lipoprotein Lpp
MKRNIYLTTIPVILTAMILTGCATMQSIDVNARSRTFDADYSTTLKAAVDYLNSDGWQIATVDKDLGLINTEFRSGSGLASILSGEERYKINFYIQKQSAAQTKVIANMLYEKKSGGNEFKSGEWTQANMTEGKAIDKYNEILNGVQLKIIK